MLLLLLLALQTGALWKISLLNYKACHVQASRRVSESERDGERVQSQWRRKTLRLMRINSAKRQLRHSQRVLPQFASLRHDSLCHGSPRLVRARSFVRSLSQRSHTHKMAHEHRENVAVRHSRSSCDSVGVGVGVGSANRVRRQPNRFDRLPCCCARARLNRLGYDAHAAKHRSSSTRDQFVAKRRACQNFLAQRSK